MLQAKSLFSKTLKSSTLFIKFQKPYKKAPTYLLKIKKKFFKTSGFPYSYLILLEDFA